MNAWLVFLIETTAFIEKKNERIEGKQKRRKKKTSLENHFKEGVSNKVRYYWRISTYSLWNRNPKRNMEPTKDQSSPRFLFIPLKLFVIPLPPNIPQKNNHGESMIMLKKVNLFIQKPSTVIFVTWC